MTRQNQSIEKALGLKIHMGIIHVIDIPAKLWMLKQDYTNSSADECSDSVLEYLTLDEEVFGLSLIRGIALCL